MTERSLPRPFNYSWGAGQVVEEASVVGRYHEPCIQLLSYDTGPRGAVAVRFCFYDLEGRFRRGPMLLNTGEVEPLSVELSKTPRLRRVLYELAVGHPPPKESGSVGLRPKEDPC